MTEKSTEQEAKLAHGAVFYTDGSCRPNPGPSGSGVHGYFYRSKAQDKPTMGDGMIISEEGYKRQGETAVFVEPLEYYDCTGAHAGSNTNNFAEVEGLSKAFALCVGKGLARLHVICDSRFAMDGVGWCEGWSRNGWMKSDGGDIANVQSWKTLYRVYKELLAEQTKVTLEWTKAHVGTRGNHEADILAAIGTFRSRRGESGWYDLTKPAIGYWKNEVDRHPFLNIRRIFFNSEEQYNESGRYTQGDSGVGDFISGKRTPITSYSVVLLNEPDPVIEAVRQAQYKHAKGNNAIMMIKCDEVFSKAHFPWIETYGADCLEGDRQCHNLLFTDATPLTLEMNPTGLSPRAIEGMNSLEEMLLLYPKALKGEKPLINGAELQIEDITHRFYKYNEVKKGKEMVTKAELLPEYVVGLTDIKIDVDLNVQGKPKKVTLPYILGLDFLHRNNLKKLEDHNPKVYLVAWAESESSYRYATVCSCDTGMGIWSNYHADRIFVQPDIT